MRQRAVVLLPTYNEVENLEAIVRAILQAAPVDVMVLDDNSPDKTGELGDELASHEARVTIVHRPNKEGLGRAYIDGFKRALDKGYARILQMDADFSHPPAHINELLRLSQDHDLVLGSRWVAGGGTLRWPWYRRAISRGGSWYARNWLGVSIRDLTGGFKCFRREVLEAIDLSQVDAAGYAFQIEVTFRALQKGFDVVESPFVFAERSRGASKMNRRILVEAMLKVPYMKLRSAP